MTFDKISHFGSRLCAAVATPPWERGLMEKPAGEQDMGGWIRGVFTDEQQQRLGVDANGQKVVKKFQALPPSLENYVSNVWKLHLLRQAKHMDVLFLTHLDCSIIF